MRISGPNVVQVEAQARGGQEKQGRTELERRENKWVEKWPVPLNP